jgi:hypothetical protein
MVVFAPEIVRDEQRTVPLNECEVVMLSAPELAGRFAGSASFITRIRVERIPRVRGRLKIRIRINFDMIQLLSGSSLSILLAH